ncbi:unnamed protein product [Nesidiocoris tenuis]|uniref:Uncharacterized protein n=1 Tax=Nesidiocoris tenuis TaxID=355587 RepID=A0A6H5HBA6_9HEMI|nr:unnamed protein product [Nesidiocoris tenuis]
MKNVEQKPRQPRDNEINCQSWDTERGEIISALLSVQSSFEIRERKTLVHYSTTFTTDEILISPRISRWLSPYTTKSKEGGGGNKSREEGMREFKIKKIRKIIQENEGKRKVRQTHDGIEIQTHNRTRSRTTMKPKLKLIMKLEVKLTIKQSRNEFNFEFLFHCGFDFNFDYEFHCKLPRTGIRFDLRASGALSAPPRPNSSLEKEQRRDFSKEDVNKKSRREQGRGRDSQLRTASVERLRSFRAKGLPFCLLTSVYMYGQRRAPCLLLYSRVWFQGETMSTSEDSERFTDSLHTAVVRMVKRSLERSNFLLRLSAAQLRYPYGTIHKSTTVLTERVMTYEIFKRNHLRRVLQLRSLCTSAGRLLFGNTQHAKHAGHSQRAVMYHSAKIAEERCPAKFSRNHLLRTPFVNAFANQRGFQFITHPNPDWRPGDFDKLRLWPLAMPYRIKLTSRESRRLIELTCPPGGANLRVMNRKAEDMFNPA